MKLRKLKEKDAPFMLEWMHDISVIKDLQTDFISKTLDDCKTFIRCAQNSTHDLHLAITDDNDIYMGTVSLKNIFDGTAEFAITIRSAAMGKGYSKFAMKKIIQIGFHKLRLSSIYWCVKPENIRAIKFYNKNGYQEVDYNHLPTHINYNSSQVKEYLWYQVKNH